MTDTATTQDIRSPSAQLFKHGVMAMDFATVGIALRRLAEYLEAPLSQIEPTVAAEPLLKGLARYNDTDFVISDTVADIQPESGRADLNALAASHGFDGPFRKPFDDDGFGLLSIVDKKMCWHRGDANASTLVCGNGSRFEAVTFILDGPSEDRFLVHRPKATAKPIVRVAADPTRNDDVQNYMWAAELPHDSITGFEHLFDLVAGLIDDALTDPEAERELSSRFVSITVPMLEKITYSRQLSELVGIGIGYHIIAQADQHLRITVDEFGAEAAAMTSMGMMATGAPPPETRERVVLGDTGLLLVWFTEGSSRLPICATLTEQAAYTPKRQRRDTRRAAAGYVTRLDAATTAV